MPYPVAAVRNKNFGGVRYGPNQAQNPGFETAGGGGADIWSGWNENVADGTIADEAVIVHSGSHACKITSGPSMNDRVYQNPNPPVAPGLTYTISFWTQGDGANAGRFGIWDNSNSGWIINIVSTGVSSATWTHVFYTFTAPAGCALITYYLYGPAFNGGIAYFDDVALQEVL